MSLIKEFHYPNISQRKLVLYNILFSSMLVGLIFSNISISIKYYLYYFPVFKTVIFTGFAGLLLGNISGRFIISSNTKFRPIYIISDVLFLTLSLLYLTRNFLFQLETTFILNILLYSPFVIAGFIFLLFFFAGIKANYFLKVSCGDFIDYGQGIEKLIIFSLIGISIGVLISSFGIIHKQLLLFSSIIPLLIIPTIFMINLAYNPPLLYAQEFESSKVNQTTIEIKENSIFLYINFISIIIYYFLGAYAVIKYYGDLIQIKLFFIAISFLAVIPGFIIGNFIKKISLSVYTQILFPIFFILFFFIIQNFNQELPFYHGIAFFIPLSVSFGISMNLTIKKIIANYDHTKRFNIIDLSLFILPGPVLISLSYLNFTYFEYFIIVYMLIFINLIIPGIYLIIKKFSLYKKILYFSFSILIIPLFFYTSIIFNVQFSNDPFKQNIFNFNKLKKIDFNTQNLKENLNIYMNGDLIFNASDSIIRNICRALSPIALYNKNINESKILFINGNQNFSNNPGLEFFSNSTSIDPIPKSSIYNNHLPATKNSLYKYKNEYPLLFFNKNKDKFSIIVDIPNILDQNNNLFRFSEEYYKLLKNHINDKGIFMQFYNTNECNEQLFYSSIKNHQRFFKRNNVYLFSNILVVISSNSKNIFDIDQKNISKLKAYIEFQKKYFNIFFNEYHATSHLLFTQIEDLLVYIKKYDIASLNFLKEKHMPFSPPEELINKYLANNKKILELINEDYNKNFLNELSKILKKDDNILSLLKMTEYAESIEDFENEMKYLFELKNLMNSNRYLKKYISAILSYKEENYYNTALRLEESKNWDKAKKLYNSILAINSNNFNANYRMGLLCITLQDIDNAFKYLQNAMKLNRNHPGVLYEMGVIKFSKGNMNEAINYFNRALSQKEINPSIFLYLGLSYEGLGNLDMAEYFYLKALEQSPEDITIKSKIDTITEKKNIEKNKWKHLSHKKNQNEDEQDMDLPLPINKSAYDIRLKDKVQKK